MRHGATHIGHRSLKNIYCFNILYILIYDYDFEFQLLVDQANKSTILNGEYCDGSGAVVMSSVGLSPDGLQAYMLTGSKVCLWLAYTYSKRPTTYISADKLIFPDEMMCSKKYFIHVDSS